MKFHPTLTADFMTTSGLLDTMAIILGFSDSIARLNFYLQLHRRSCEREDRYVFRDEEWPGLEADGGRRRAHPGVELKSGKYRGQGEWSRVVRGAPRGTPGKVEGVNAGKGPFRAREVPVPTSKSRQAPGKVEGGSAGKGPSPARSMPVPKPRRVPGKVEGVSAGKGPSRAREVPVPKPRQTPGKVEGGSAGKGLSPARGMPVPKPRRVPGKVEGVSAGKGPSRAREVPVPKPRQTPGKVEGGSAGKGPSPARGVPVPKPRRVPGKVEGVSAGKGPFRTRGVRMSKREWKRTSGRRMCQFKVAQDKGEVVEGIDCHKENVHYVICPTGWSSCKLRKGRESTAVSGGFSRGQTRCKKVNGKTGKRRDKYPVATKLEVRMLYSGPIHPSGWVEQVKQVGTCKSSEERVGDECNVPGKSSEDREEDKCDVTA
ncbi:Hypp9653 [Branchiostoma lanceolatum]|uniref:Hypp9653 protein n=1 Tax=Branchiostoma lanceolatum TaxID=7740 RepID=A0A8S4MNR4_BRALA|nr:Hypp9653 [Branchiostoma lanceolatum]